MALTSTGAISLAGSTVGSSIELEIYNSSTFSLNLNDARARAFANITATNSTISLNNFRGLSNNYLITENSNDFQFHGFNVDSLGYIYAISTNPTNNYVYIHKLTQSGILLKSVQVSSSAIILLNGTNPQYGNNNTSNLIVGQDGYIYFTYFYLPGAPTMRSSIIKLDTNLNIIWQTSLNAGTNYQIQIRTTTVDSSGRVYLGCYWDYALSGSQSGIILIRLTSSGTIDWQYYYYNVNNGGQFPTQILLNGNNLYMSSQYNLATGGGGTNGTLVNVSAFNISTATPTIVASINPVSSGYSYAGPLAADSSGNIYWLFYLGPASVDVIYKMNSSLTVTAASSGTAWGNYYGSFNTDSAGNLYFADTSNMQLTSFSSTLAVNTSRYFILTPGGNTNNVESWGALVDPSSNSLIMGVTMVDTVITSHNNGTIVTFTTKFYDTNNCIIKLPLDGSKTGVYQPHLNTATITWTTYTAASHSIGYSPYSPGASFAAVSYVSLVSTSTAFNTFTDGQYKQNF